MLLRAPPTLLGTPDDLPSRREVKKMTSGDTTVLLVEVGVIALTALVALFRGR